MPSSKLERAVASVSSSGRCSGCGACALVSPSISLKLSEEGFLRPEVTSPPLTSEDKNLTRDFRRICPGVAVDARDLTAPMAHPVFGKYFGVWTGYASDDLVRFRGSSGGVLTALSVWLLESKRASQIAGVGAQVGAPSRSIPVRILSRDEALAASGSRYAPVANASQYDPEDSTSVFVGKPCEIYAASRLSSRDGDAGPVRLSFFCAGTPSQLATDGLIEKMGGNADHIKSLQYRGNGWPGYFKFENEAGEVSQLSYDDSWGKHLGRSLQWRCKVCVDGTGEFADIAVGDYWETDEKGYPSFSDSEGNSIVIARTARGLALVHEAVAAGVLRLSPATIDGLMSIQPLQRIRRSTIIGRLAGRVLAGRSVPIYKGFSLLRLTAGHLRQNMRAAAGTFLRTVRGK